MNADDIIARVKRTFGDESGAQVEDADIYRWINDAQREVIIHSESVLPATGMMDLVREQREYQFPDDLFMIRSLSIKPVDSNNYIYVQFVNLSEFESAFARGGTLAFPRVYTTYDRTIFLHPTPNYDAENGLKLLYSKNPLEVSENQKELSLPEIYHNAIVKYCMKQVNLMDEDYEAAVLFDGDFTSSVMSLQNLKSREPTDAYPSITVLPEDEW